MYKRISDLCIREGITVAKLENILGFGKGTIQKWKESSPSVGKLVAVADHFGVSIDYLAGRKSGAQNE